MNLPTFLTSPAGQLLALFLLLTLLLQIHNTLTAWLLRAIRWLTPAFPLLVGELLLFILLVYSVDYPNVSDFNGALWRFLAALPGKILYGIVPLCALLTGLIAARLNTLRRAQVTPFAIQESLDDLPAGIAIGDPQGIPFLVNKEIDWLSGELFDAPLTNTRQFWQALAERSLTDDSGGPVVLLPDGRTYGFRRDMVTRNGVIFEQITATDITEQYALTQTLREKNEQLSAMKRRLLRYQEDVTEVTREREILAAKIAVHDDVGHALLATTHYLTQPEDADPAHVLDLWKKTAALLSGGAGPEAEVNAAATLIRAARSVGIQVEVEGSLPEENPARNLILNALHECITNTLKHAGGDRLRLTVRETDTDYTVTFSNNGALPDLPIRETGGLRLVRQMAEDSGGAMEIRTAPVFTLILTAPKGDPA